MQSINKYKADAAKARQDDKPDLALNSVTKRELTIDSVVDGRTTESESTVVTKPSIEVILKLEAELTRVQGKKTKAVETLGRLRLERIKVSGQDDDFEDDGFLEAMGSVVDDVWDSDRLGDDVIV